MFQHNAWDNVTWGEEQEAEAQEAVLASSRTRVEEARAEDLENKAGEYWDKFYSVHQNRFFKERNWLFTEFPDLGKDNIQHQPSLDISDNKGVLVVDLCPSPRIQGSSPSVAGGTNSSVRDPVWQSGGGGDWSGPELCGPTEGGRILPGRTFKLQTAGGRLRHRLHRLPHPGDQHQARPHDLLL